MKPYTDLLWCHSFSSDRRRPLIIHLITYLLHLLTISYIAGSKGEKLPGKTAYRKIHVKALCILELELVSYYLRNSHRRCHIKEQFLKILQNSQESESLFMQLYTKDTPTQVFSSVCCKISKNTCFKEHLRMTGSVTCFYMEDLAPSL